MKLGEISVTLKNNDQAIQFYKDAIEVSSNDISVLTALAKLYMQVEFFLLFNSLFLLIVKF